MSQDAARKRELGLIHMGKAFLAQQAGMSPADYEPDYRALLVRECGVASAAQLDARGRDKLLRHMKACGFKVLAAKGSRPKVSTPNAPQDSRQPLGDPMHKKLRALWYALADVEAVDRPVNALACDDAVETWAKRQIRKGSPLGKLDALRFANGEQLSKLIEELKRWGARVQARMD